MSHLFAAILLFSSPGCPHEEPTCITPTEYVKINFSSTGYFLTLVSRAHSRRLRAELKRVPALAEALTQHFAKPRNVVRIPSLTPRSRERT